MVGYLLFGNSSSPKLVGNTFNLKCRGQYVTKIRQSFAQLA